MTKFIITYHGSGSPDPSERESAMAAFGAWLASTGDSVIDPGAPTRPAAQVGAETDLVPIGGYTILEADSVEAAQALLAGHPFVTRGGTLQINEVMGV